MSVYQVKKNANKRDGRAKLLSVFLFFCRRSRAVAVAKAPYFLMLGITCGR